jgi:hypothetical protein
MTQKQQWFVGHFTATSNNWLRSSRLLSEGRLPTSAMKSRRLTRSPRRLTTSRSLLNHYPITPGTWRGCETSHLVQAPGRCRMGPSARGNASLSQWWLVRFWPWSRMTENRAPVLGRPYGPGGLSRIAPNDLAATPPSPPHQWSGNPPAFRTLRGIDVQIPAFRVPGRPIFPTVVPNRFQNSCSFALQS